MNILQTIVTLVTSFLSIFGKKITVSQTAESTLQEIKDIYDNRAAILAGTYDPKMTGSPEWDAIILMVVNFIKKYGADNMPKVEEEIQSLLTTLQPIVDDFVADTAVATGTSKTAPAVPAQTQTEAPAAPVTSFLGTALEMIENILGQSQSEHTEVMKTIDTNATNAKQTIQAHIDAAAANPKFPTTFLKGTTVPSLANIVDAVKAETNITPTLQNISDSATMAQGAVLSHISQANKK